ncbi:glycoside hydrolase family 47 protein [Zopfia rhizophila CBS 207.26]|uniref:alpha-1,2-Mannosidase n=1 Tax=Zopfia rhizophila CBS 207.26 TaxID=1314779 RepID=A0A6A6D7I6_9PEZI|nr:glycoside hydrolase family 47 protein [Zopfia rhizophila CBS 207.26]
MASLSSRFAPSSRSFFPLSHQPSSKFPSKSCPNVPPNPSYTPVNNTRFSWRNVAIKHPVPSFVHLPTARPSPLARIQHVFEQPSQETEDIRKERQQAVKQAFERGWNSYKERAWLQDELKPISGGSANTFGGWGATLVDSLDTLWIMNMTEDFEFAVSAAVNINFGPETSIQELSLFETVIRFLGGFLSAYDLTECKDSRLLQKAVEIGDLIYTAFDTPNRMPITRWNPRKAAEGKDQSPPSSGLFAEIGSFTMEFTRLSQITGDMRYFDAIVRITDAMDHQQNRTKLPDMWPTEIDISAPDLTKGSKFSLGAEADSTYEYLPKTYQLLHGVEPFASQYQRMYEYAMDTAIRHTLFRPIVPDKADVLFPSKVYAEDASSARRESSVEHLVCFVGGMLLLGGRLFGNDSHIDIGRKVGEGCAWAYRNSPVGIMGEESSLSPCPSLAECEYEGNGSGFTGFSHTVYLLRPEAIESIFYLYRVTGNSSYQDMAWEMFQAIEKNTRTEFANAALRDMTRQDPPKDDSMQSFWLAETLKYLYLVFSEPDLISLDEFVYNTEAHPFRLPK